MVLLTELGQRQPDIWPNHSHLAHGPFDGDRVRLHEKRLVQWLQPIGRKELLARMLRNLKLIYARQDDDVMLFKMLHWILTLQPEAPAELGERAMLYEAMGNPSRAARDWERYLANVGDHKSVTTIRARVDNLKKQQSRIH